MKDIFKTLFYEIFQKLIIISVVLIPCFYWPNHEARLMKFICLQTYISIMLALSFFFEPKRTIKNFYPALFLVIALLNLISHGMNDYINVGVSFIFISIIGFYILSNYLHFDYVPAMKKSIVILCIINCILFLAQTYGLNLIFIVHKQTVTEPWLGRPSGALCYPASFAMLCAVSFFLSWEWQKLLCIPIGICLAMSHEYSVIAGFIVALIIPLWKEYWKYILPLAIIGTGIFIFKDYVTIYSKAALRFKFLYPVFQNVWGRPIDGIGCGMYNRMPESFFGFYRGNWSEMHCEPLDVLFCMGLIGCACVWGWIKNSLKNMNMKYMMIFTVIGITACFHSPLHFADTLWICVVLLALMEIEKYESAP